MISSIKQATDCESNAKILERHSETLEDLSEMIKTFRKKHCITQPQFCKAAGIGLENLKNIEKLHW